ncbi:cation:proton antiporter [Caenispirillum salinarum]|uniref:cation:proton antiporter n=1 Tax=Caenispirillum salinarum TaxID=859058 RepID=UPI00384D5EDF
MGLDNVFHELSVVLLFAAAVGAVGLVLKQPLVVSFIAAGILAGPSVLDIATASEHLDVLAKFGIAILLFVVGLKLDLHLIRTMGAVALTTGLGQVLFTSVIGFFICLWLGMDPLASLYIAVAITFSSTIIIVKLLSDKGEIDALHGRVALGFLIVQDIVVVLVMVIVSALAAGTGTANGEALGAGGIALRVAEVVGKGVLMVGGVALFIRYLARPMFDRIARSQELMVLLAVGLAVAFASGADLLGFSMELGAFLAGVALASTPYRDVIGARLNPLRDFMLLFFFISLGSHMDVTTVGDQIVPALALSAFVLIGNPLIVLVIMGVMGYRKRTGFLAGLTVAQISEFSLIFMAMGLTLGHVTGADVGLVTLVGIVTIGLSTYMILYSHRLYRWLEPVLGPFERKVAHREAGPDDEAVEARPDVILFGLGRYGSNIVRGLARRDIAVLGVDFDPEVVRERREAGWSVVYGDASDPDFAETLPLSTANWVILAVPAVRPVPGASDPSETNVRALRAGGYGGRIAATAHSAADAARLKRAGADVVLLPYADAARRAVEVIADAGNPDHAEAAAPNTVTPLAKGVAADVS